MLILAFIFGTWTYRPDLSYQPTTPYAHIDLFYLKPGTMGEAEKLTKEHADIDRAVGIRHAREIYVGDDVIMQIVRANSRSEYEAERKASDALRGERIRPVYAADTKVLRRIISIDDFGLPGANGLVTLDYLAFDHARGRLWIPAGNTASVDVLDDSSIRRIGGFATRQFELKGRRGFLGPSSVSIGEGKIFIGNRADSSICTIDASTLRRGRCVNIAAAADGWAAAPDAVIYVAATRELWVTRGAPPLGIASSDRAITILDVDQLRVKTKLPLGASAEGYAVDGERGILYTNLEESGETVAIDVHSRSIQSRWRSGCDEPHGIGLDQTRRFVFVACADRVIALDAGHDGKVLDTIATGDGLDNIDYFDGHLYAAASVAATITIARVADDGTFHDPLTVPSVKGGRVVVAGAGGSAYVADPVDGRILRISPK